MSSLSLSHDGMPPGDGAAARGRPGRGGHQGRAIGDGQGLGYLLGVEHVCASHAASLASSRRLLCPFARSHRTGTTYAADFAAVSRHRNVMGVYDTHPVVGENAFVAPNASVIGDVTLGSGSSVWYGAILRGALRDLARRLCTEHARAIRAPISRRSCGSAEFGVPALTRRAAYRRFQQYFCWRGHSCAGSRARACGGVGAGVRATASCYRQPGDRG